MSRATGLNEPVSDTGRNTRGVFVEPLWNLHAHQRQLAAFPPPGFQVHIDDRSASQRLVQNAARSRFALPLQLAVDRLVPVAMVRSWLQGRQPAPAGTDLTYAVDHLVFRPGPWVLEVEYCSALAGVRLEHFLRFRRIIERRLASDDCRGVVCWSEAGRDSVLNDMRSEPFAHKVQVIRYGIPARQFTKQYRDDRVKVLFVGSGASSGRFEDRAIGLFEAYEQLQQRYDHVEFVVRSDVPEEIKARYAGAKNLRILDKPIPRADLEQEYLSADIFLVPSYNTLPLTILDAMSYELPVVTVDGWANGEYVQDGVTGMVSQRSRWVPRRIGSTSQPNIIIPNFRDLLRKPDPEALADFVTRLARLVDDADLRRQMGRAARAEVETGRFSLARANQNLAAFFEQALAGEVGR